MALRKKHIAALCFSVLIAGGMALGSASSAQAANPLFGGSTQISLPSSTMVRIHCPVGDVCLYPQTDELGGVPPESNGVWYHYGSHNLTNQTGGHWILNNQTGGAPAYACTGSNGNGTCYLIPAGKAAYGNFGPIYSVYMRAA